MEKGHALFFNPFKMKHMLRLTLPFTNFCTLAVIKGPLEEDIMHYDANDLR